MIATLYYETVPNEPRRTRAILPKAMVEYYKLDIKLSSPDDAYPAEFSGRYVPAMKWADGTIQEESIAIVLALSELAGELGLKPGLELFGDGSIEAKAQIVQWMCKFNYNLMDCVTPMLGMVLKRRPADRAEYDRLDETVKKFLDNLEAYLQSRKYLVGDQISIADFYGCTYLYRLLSLMYDSAWQKAHPKVVSWFKEASNHAIFCGFFDDFKFIEEFKPEF